MTVLLLLPAIASILTLCAHFVRSGNLPIAILLLAVLPLLTIRERWVARVAQALLLLSAAVWISILVGRIGERMAIGLPYGRAAAILGGTAAFTAASALLFATPRLRRFYAAAR